MAKQPKKPTKQPKGPRNGRVKKPADELRENVLRIRLTEAERKVLDDAATGESLETSSWARAVLLKEARRLAGRAHVPSTQSTPTE